MWFIGLSYVFFGQMDGIEWTEKIGEGVLRGIRC